MNPKELFIGLEREEIVSKILLLLFTQLALRMLLNSAQL
jgi:hypothetical protein